MISLAVPVYNECETLAPLFESMIPPTFHESQNKSIYMVDCTRNIP